ncbi:MAG: DUF58 domain-containing protein [Pseudomonadota bacterium]
MVARSFGFGGAARAPASGLTESDLAYREGEAQSLAARLPALLIEAMKVSSTIAHGIHGRRRVGPGETFWQFRQYGTNDDAATIDWRRSASSDHLFIREREWEAAHTFWLWLNLSETMNFRSHLSETTKRDRAVVLMLAAAEMLVKAGERVALLGLSRPTASRSATRRLAETVSTNATGAILNAELPPAEPLGRFSGALLISDFLAPIEETGARIRALAANGVSGHLIQVLDPAEEVLPYDGRAEFVGMAGETRWVADRTETLREAYQAKLHAHRGALQEIARRAGWSFTVHHTDRAPTEPLLSLIMRLQASDGLAAGGGA